MVRSQPGSPAATQESVYLVDEIPSSASKDHPDPLNRLVSRSRSRISLALADPQERKTVFMVLAAFLILIIGKFHGSIDYAKRAVLIHFQFFVRDKEVSLYHHVPIL